MVTGRRASRSAQRADDERSQLLTVAVEYNAPLGDEIFHKAYLDGRGASTISRRPLMTSAAAPPLLGSGTSVTGSSTSSNARRRARQIWFHLVHAGHVRQLENLDVSSRGTYRRRDLGHDTLTIGESAVVNAKISGTTIIIEGCVTGDLCARQRLELRASSRYRPHLHPCW